MPIYIVWRVHVRRVWPELRRGISACAHIYGFARLGGAWELCVRKGFSHAWTSVYVFGPCFVYSGESSGAASYLLAHRQPLPARQKEHGLPSSRAWRRTWTRQHTTRFGGRMDVGGSCRKAHENSSAVQARGGPERRGEHALSGGDKGKAQGNGLVLQVRF